MSLVEIIPKILERADQLRTSRAANEANTKALLIEPVLAALAWDLNDLNAVEREVMVFEGTFLDYALKIDGEARLYIEAKGIAENLDDKKFVAQTVNYANNDGVLWCVLTNGLRYRVYKTNEPVAMDRKLLFEVDLADAQDPVREKARLLALVSREGVETGELAEFGDRVFTDTRVRSALSSLASDPPATFIEEMTRRLGSPRVDEHALRRSLARVLDAPEPATREPARVTPARGPIGPTGPPKGQEYPLDHHLGGKSSLIHELFEEVDQVAMALGADVTRRVRKQYIGYFRGKRSFCTVEAQRRRLLLFFSLDPNSVRPWDDEVMRDVSSIGHFGMGDTEFSLRSTDQLETLRALVSQAYEMSG